VIDNGVKDSDYLQFYIGSKDNVHKSYMKYWDNLVVLEVHKSTDNPQFYMLSKDNLDSFYCTQKLYELLGQSSCIGGTQKYRQPTVLYVVQGQFWIMSRP
jgi:hypothetical protein